MTFQDVLDCFFLPEDQDAFAKSQGYSDSDQMCYYEDMAQAEQSKLHELDKVDPREVYTDSEDCPSDGDYSDDALQRWAGVY